MKEGECGGSGFFGKDESKKHYIGNAFADFLTKLNQSGQMYAVRRYYEKLLALNDLRGNASKQFLLAVAADPVPFFLHKKDQYLIGPNAKGSQNNPLMVSLPKKSHLFLYIQIFLTCLLLIVLLSYLFGEQGSSKDSLISIIREKKYEPNSVPNVKFENVKGNVEPKVELSNLIGYLSSPSKYETVRIPRGVLLYGPPGTGKTLLARALAGESGVPFISVSGSEFDEVFAGIGPKRMKKLFADARALAPCIVFIDEIDAIGGRDKFMNYENHTLNQLLVELDGFSSSSDSGVVIIGATNEVDHLDKALLRPGRFDRKIAVSYPDIGARKEILQYYLSKHKASNKIDINILARETANNTGADLENLVNMAAINAIKLNKPEIGMEDVEESLLTVIMGRERKTLTQTKKNKWITAYHEGGHALVALLTPHSPEIRQATILPRGEALGMVNYLGKDDLLGSTKQEYIARMRMGMGGRAAEEIIYGQEYVTTGASNDFQNATRIAYNMVTKLGMSRLGQIFLSDKNIGHRTTYSEMSQKIEVEVKHLLDDSYFEAKTILSENIDSLHKVAAALMKYETLTKAQLENVVKGEPIEGVNDSLEQEI